MRGLLDFLKKSLIRTSQSLPDLYFNLNVVRGIVKSKEFNDMPIDLQKEFLELLMELVQSDIQTSYMSAALKTTRTLSNVSVLFPFKFLGLKDYEVMEQEIVLNDKCVVIPTWKPRSLTYLFGNVKKNGYIKNLCETYGYYIPALNLVFIVNGRHRLATSIMAKKECTAMVEVYDFVERPNIDVYRHYGHIFWASLNEAGERIDSVEMMDVRFAILWQLYVALTDLSLSRE